MAISVTPLRGDTSTPIIRTRPTSISNLRKYQDSYIWSSQVRNSKKYKKKPNNHIRGKVNAHCAVLFLGDVEDEGFFSYDIYFWWYDWRICMSVVDDYVFARYV